MSTVHAGVDGRCGWSPVAIEARGALAVGGRAAILARGRQGSDGPAAGVGRAW